MGTGGVTVALNFPPNPTPGFIYTHGSRSWIWNGYAWDVYQPYSINIDGGRANEVYGSLPGIDGGTA